MRTSFSGQSYWRAAIENAKDGPFWDAVTTSKYWKGKLPSPILLAGGVVLLDQPEPAQFAPGSALVPLLLRDIAAPADPLRLTTPAGRMDKLDLAEVCISELAAVLEFRMFVAANLTGAVDRQAQFNREELTLGNLRGAVDGDGYNRPILFVSYLDLQTYVRQMASTAGDALTRSDPHPDALSVRAMTDGQTGRFRALDKGYRLSVAALTTAVAKVL